MIQNSFYLFFMSHQQYIKGKVDKKNLGFAYVGDRIRTFVSTKLTALEAVPFDHSGIPAYGKWEN